MGPRELKHNVISETKMRKALTISLLQAKQLYQTDAYLYCFQHISVEISLSLDDDYIFP